MYILWGRGAELLDFENHNCLPAPSLDKKNFGVRFLQLLRADLITIPEK